MIVDVKIDVTAKKDLLQPDVRHPILKEVHMPVLFQGKLRD